MAANNTNCEVAVLVQVLKPVERMYLGTLTAGGMRADLDMIHIRQQPPADCLDYDGLVRLISNKIRIEPYKLEPLTSVRFTYMLSEWPEEACWSQSPPDLDLELGAGGDGDLGFSGLTDLPFGLLYDPVRELQLSAVWPCLAHGTFHDSATKHTLDPCKASLWTAKVLPTTGSSDGPQVAGLLGEHLVQLLAACKDQRSVVNMLGPAFDDHGSDGVVGLSSALDRLTEHSVPSLGSVIMGRRRRRHHGASVRSDRSPQGPLSTEVLVPMLNYLFPEDGEDETHAICYPSNLGRVPNWPENLEGLPDDHPLKDVSVGVKGAPAEGLVWRLSVLCCHALQSLGGLPAVAHLLYELMLELRFRWDNCQFVPGVDQSNSPPDLASSLLQQKLQMLNCCIQHRANTTGTVNSAGGGGEEHEVEEMDEFFDCMTEDEDTEEEVEEPASKRQATTASVSSWDRPEGRLRSSGQLRLLGTDTRLYVPVTQDPAPVTEDKLEEQAQVLLRLGDTDEGSVMRARLMSSSLLSDMEAFKAANPGCQLADFVRWYSPRDWVPVAASSSQPSPPAAGGDVVRQGHRLSDRMTLPGNLWQEVWQSAHPVPARRQKRLFDEAREAEQALMWLGQLAPGELCQQLLPVLLHAACCRVAREPTLYTLPSSAVWGNGSTSSSSAADGAAVTVPVLQHCSEEEGLAALLALVTQRLGRLSRQPCDLLRYHDVVEQLIAIEKCIGRALSLRHKLLPNNTSRRSSNVSGTTDTDDKSNLNKSGVRNRDSGSNFSNKTSNASTTDVNVANHSTDDSDSSTDINNESSDDTVVLQRLISSLLSSGEVEVDGAATGVAGQAILRLFDRALQYQERYGLIPNQLELERHRRSQPPSSRRSLAQCTKTRLGYAGAREYIVRTRAEYPSGTSRVMPHRLYATFLNNDFRVAGLFTQDTTFT
uniref:Rab3 GTPase-activating protein catalytic subunit n=1 Tax=Hirondellea gigas TaxID=1518452 RepID=A0A2P2I434_9CRUS